jgi:hypothetical protein
MHVAHTLACSYARGPAGGTGPFSKAHGFGDETETSSRDERERPRQTSIPFPDDETKISNPRCPAAARPSPSMVRVIVVGHLVFTVPSSHGDDQVRGMEEGLGPQQQAEDAARLRFGRIFVRVIKFLLPCRSYISRSWRTKMITLLTKIYLAKKHSRRFQQRTYLHKFSTDIRIWHEQ